MRREKFYFSLFAMVALGSILIHWNGFHADCIKKSSKHWKRLKGQYLFNEFALAAVFRGRFLAAMTEAEISPPKTPTKWIVDCELVGRGCLAISTVNGAVVRPNEVIKCPWGAVKVHVLSPHMGY
jgi:hypothetical protein